MSDMQAKLDKLADATKRAADNWMAQTLKFWPDDADMIEGGKKDQADLIAVADAIRAGEIKKAAKLADVLDTIVREAIPECAWEFMHNDWN